MKLSIVAPIYRSETHIPEFYRRIVAAAEKLTPDLELIFVNDASPDGSLAAALALAAGDSRVKVVNLARNYGEMRARMVGILHSSGDRIFLIQPDLDVAPEVVALFWKSMAEDPDVDLVHGLQSRRRGNLCHNFFAALFYRGLSWVSSLKLSPNAVACRMMSRTFAKALSQHREQTMFFTGLCEITGFNQRSVLLEKRPSSTSSFSLPRKFFLVLDALTSFSSFPLKMVLFFGMAISLFSSVYIIRILYRWASSGIPLLGWPSLIVSVWFFGGATLLSLGVIGIYLSNIFIETKQRPYFIVKSLHGGFPRPISED